MSAIAALLSFTGLIAWLFIRDIRRRQDVSGASWLVLVWVIIFASRPVSTWLQIDSGARTPDAYLEGNPIERAVFLLLILVGAVILMKRRISLGTVLAQNAWIMVFFGYCLISVAWSDYPFVAFKRWFKDFGNVVVVLVLLTEQNPVEAIKAVFLRSAYLLVPLSVLFIRYYPELGRVYGGYSGNDLMYVGVATHKNTLGALLLVATIFLVWESLQRGRNRPALGGRLGRADNAVVVLMSLWLLTMINSATALLCTIVGLIILGVLHWKRTSAHLRYIEIYVIGGVGAWLVLDGLFNLSDLVILSLGRDLTLTTRTDAWDLLIGAQPNVVVGAGFKSFWAGERMTRLWEDLPGIVQAHSGYVETYLNGGILGLIVLGMMLLASFGRIKRDLVAATEFAAVRLTFLVITLLYNYSEAAFNQLSLLWFVTVLIMIEAPPRAQSAEVVQVPMLAGRFNPAVGPKPQLQWPRRKVAQQGELGGNVAFRAAAGQPRRMPGR